MHSGFGTGFVVSRFRARTAAHMGTRYGQNGHKIRAVIGAQKQLTTKPVPDHETTMPPISATNKFKDL